MRFATFLLQGRQTYGVASEDGRLLDLAPPHAGSTGTPQTLIDLIRAGREGLDAADRALRRAPPGDLINPGTVTWLPPLIPGKICGVALNNSASNTRKISAPDHPAFFLKPPSCLVGHLQPLSMRRYYGSMHPEPELAVIVGRTMRDVDAVDALGHVFAYSIMNDITGNDMRGEDLFHYYALYADDSQPGGLARREQHLSYAGRYKGCDCFGVLGPWLVTANEVPDPDDLTVTCRVAGELVAEDSTRFYNYKVAEILSYISQFHTLSPGDVVSCGTAFKPSQNRKSIHHANLLKVGGPVEIEIQHLGRQCNPVIIEDKEIGAWRL
jgi:2,4-diketo-3-deoxy-L-fuconate hydrolase